MLSRFPAANRQRQKLRGEKGLASEIIASAFDALEHRPNCSWNAGCGMRGSSDKGELGSNHMHKKINHFAFRRNPFFCSLQFLYLVVKYLTIRRTCQKLWEWALFSGREASFWGKQVLSAKWPSFCRKNPPCRNTERPKLTTKIDSAVFCNNFW